MALIIASIATEPPQPTDGLDLQAPAKMVMWPGNTQAIYLFGVTKIAPGSDPPAEVPVADAAITATLVDGQGNPVTGLNDISFTLLGSPPSGDYVALVGETFNPPIAGDYTLEISGTESTNESLSLAIPIEVQAREN